MAKLRLKGLSFLQFFLSLHNILTGTLDGSLSLFALFVIRLVTVSNLLTLMWTLNNSITETCITSTMKAVLKLHALTQDLISHVLSLITKVRSCDSFIICTMVDLSLSVISTFELVLIASNWAPLTFWQHISRVYLFVSLSAHRLWLFCLSAYRLGS